MIGPGIESRTYNVVLIRTQSIHFPEHTTSSLDISFRSLKTSKKVCVAYARAHSSNHTDPPSTTYTPTYGMPTFYLPGFIFGLRASKTHPLCVSVQVIIF